MMEISQYLDEFFEFIIFLESILGLLGVIIVSNSHSILFPCVRKLFSLKILFSMETEDARSVTALPDVQKYLMLLEAQRALVLNRNTGERYGIKTIDFPKQKPTLK